MLLCIARATAPSLTPRQLECIYEIARTSLLAFVDLLRAQDWTSIEAGMDDKRAGREAIWARILPHRVSFLLTAWIIEPLIAVCEDKPACRTTIPHTDNDSSH